MQLCGSCCQNVLQNDCVDFFFSQHTLYHFHYLSCILLCSYKVNNFVKSKIQVCGKKLKFTYNCLLVFVYVYQQIWMNVCLICPVVPCTNVITLLEVFGVNVKMDTSTEPLMILFVKVSRLVFTHYPTLTTLDAPEE